MQLLLPTNIRIYNTRITNLLIRQLSTSQIQIFWCPSREFIRGSAL
jgi:hypothetical protein